MYKLSALELRDKFRRGECTAAAIVKHFLERIEKYDGQIGAFLTVFNERAMQQAKALDEKSSRKTVRKAICHSHSH